MNNGDIAFPNLGIYLKDVPVSFSVFGFPIAYYGLIIGIGVMAGLLMAAHVAKKTGQNPDDYWDFAIWAVIFSVIGARIYYVFFSWEDYRDNLLDIFKFRNGGMAIYGGVIAAFITLFIWCRIKKKNPFLVGDTCMPGLILGQAIGRWGNFMNREVFGDYYNGLFSMQIPVADVRDRSDITERIASHIPEGANYINVHPTFLYESVWNLLILALLLVWRKHKKFDGELCLLYLGGYGLGRFFIEGIRTDTLFLPGTRLPVSQVLALVMVLFSVITDGIVRIRLKKSPSAKKN
ncbi:MAG: prolipoprotein diacylglyceryl transferase [Roseburia sp.]|nr:prolipoprotein diacylglyceryl transferase [Roseburia sp.]MCM1099318.1 prolipoprotein diacylglyceryl transferase [Ruminococcus flavefaciens]